MTDQLEKCSICNALLDEEDLFCANCGTEAPHQRREQGATQLTTHNFSCTGCGASMSYSATAQTLKCPFCGSTKLDKQQDTKELAPQSVIPFQIERPQAIQIMRNWLGSSWWRPGDLAQSAVVTNMTQVLVPYWVFQADTFTYWTADTSQTPFGARGDWAPLTGSHRGKYSGVLVGASSALTPQETHAICPFDLSSGVPPDQTDLESMTTEPFRVQRKYARPQARRGLENLETEACHKYVPGRARNVQVNMRLENLQSQPVLLPVWIMAYQYNQQVYRFLVNGQTGQSTGNAPHSWRKVLLVVGIAVAVLFAILIGVGLLTTIAAAVGMDHRPGSPRHTSPAPRQVYSTTVGLPLESQRLVTTPALRAQPTLARSAPQTQVCSRLTTRWVSASPRDRLHFPPVVPPPTARRYLVPHRAHCHPS